MLLSFSICSTITHHSATSVHSPYPVSSTPRFRISSMSGLFRLPDRSFRLPISRLWRSSLRARRAMCGIGWGGPHILSNAFLSKTCNRGVSYLPLNAKCHSFGHNSAFEKPKLLSQEIVQSARDLPQLRKQSRTRHVRCNIYPTPGIRTLNPAHKILHF